MKKKPIKILIVSVILIIVALLLIILIFIKMAANGMADNTYKYSGSIENSKNNDFFIGYYYPSKDSIKIGSLNMKAENIWVEKNWTTKHYLLFWKKIKVDSGVKIILPFDVYLFHSNEISLNVKDHGVFHNMIGYENLGYTHTFDNYFPDTIIISYGLNWGIDSKDSILYFSPACKEQNDKRKVNKKLIDCNSKYIMDDCEESDDYYNDKENFIKKYTSVKQVGDTLIVKTLKQINACGETIGDIWINGDTIKLEARQIADEVCASIQYNLFTYRIENKSRKKFIILTNE